MPEVPAPRAVLTAWTPRISEQIVQLYRDLHRHPELSMQEHHTAAAVVAAMTSKLTEPGTGQRAKQVDWMQMAERKLARAKLLDAMEGTPSILRANDLAAARFGADPIRTTEESGA